MCSHLPCTPISFTSSRPAQIVLSARSISPVTTRGQQSPMVSPRMAVQTPKSPQPAPNAGGLYSGKVSSSTRNFILI